MRIISEGTKSYLLGCHHWLIHPWAVLKAWKKIYRRRPTWREVICVFIHDIGLVGMNYLSGNKNGHWERGACLAGLLFGRKYFLFCAGHTDESGILPRSDLFAPDKICWLFIPRRILDFWQWFEGFNSVCTTDEWLDRVEKNFAAGFPKTGHQMWLEAKEEHECKKLAEAK
jgi:hypothetical protein